jgi:hypothetical protein
MRRRVYEPGCSDEVIPIVRHGWCRGCSKAVQIEYVPSMEELEQEAELINKEEPLPFNDPEKQKLFNQRRFVFLPPKMALVAIAEYIRWRNARKNPARCFECGSDQVALGGGVIRASLRSDSMPEVQSNPVLEYSSSVVSRK